MIKHGADINQTGWLKIDEDWLFGTPLELALFMESSGKDVEEMKKQLISANESKWNQLDPTGKSKTYFHCYCLFSRRSSQPCINFKKEASNPQKT
jgi:hypothetical protein